MPIMPLAIAALVGLASTAAHAAAIGTTSTEPGSGGQTGSQAGARDVGIHFSNEPLKVAEAGLSIFLPEGLRTETTSLGLQKTSISITPPESDWLIRVETARTARQATSALEVVTDLKRRLREMAASVNAGDSDSGRANRTRTRVFDEVTLEPGAEYQLRGERFYAEIPDGRASVFHGYTVYKVEPDQFVTFQLISPTASFEKARRHYETILGATRFEDVAGLRERQVARIADAEAFLETLTHADFEAVLGTEVRERWERLYEPAPTGDPRDDKEIAYRRVRTWTGHRGELNPQRARRSWTAEERQEGYLVRIDARTLLDDGQVMDSEGLYFLSLDRETETWSISVSFRIPGRSRNAQTFNETAARQDRTIKVSRPEGTTDFSAGQAYLSSVEALVLPYLLMRKEAEGDFTFYTYNSAAGSIVRRRQEVTRPAKLSGGWEIRSWLGDELEPKVSLFTATEDLLRQHLPLETPRVWTPTSHQDLLRLWKAKNLPIN